MWSKLALKNGLVSAQASREEGSCADSISVGLDLWTGNEKLSTLQQNLKGMVDILFLVCDMCSGTRYPFIQSLFPICCVVNALT